VGAVSPKALEHGIKINEIIKGAAGVLGGGGGGKPQLAQGAGRHPEKINEALKFVYNDIKSRLSQKSLNGFI
jgi:alanyl-tRNA synthetase